MFTKFFVSFINKQAGFFLNYVTQARFFQNKTYFTESGMKLKKTTFGKY